MVRFRCSRFVCVLCWVLHLWFVFCFVVDIVVFHFVFSFVCQFGLLILDLFCVMMVSCLVGWLGWLVGFVV